MIFLLAMALLISLRKRKNEVQQILAHAVNFFQPSKIKRLTQKNFFGGEKKESLFLVVSRFRGTIFAFWRLDFRIYFLYGGWGFESNHPAHLFLGCGVVGESRFFSRRFGGNYSFVFFLFLELGTLLFLKKKKWPLLI